MSVAHSMDVDTEELDWSGSEASYSPAVAVVVRFTQIRSYRLR